MRMSLEMITSVGGGGGEQGIRAFRGRGGGMEKRYVFTKSFKISC